MSAYITTYTTVAGYDYVPSIEPAGDSGDLWQLRLARDSRVAVNGEAIVALFLTLAPIAAQVMGQKQSDASTALPEPTVTE